MLGLLGIAGFPMVVHGSVAMPPLDAWLRQAPVPDTVQQAILARRATDPQARGWLVTQDQQVYALAFQPLSLTLPAVIQQALRGQVEQQVRELLFLYAAGEHYQRQGYVNREAMAKALVMLDAIPQGRLLPGLQSRAAILDQGAVALVWIGEDRIASYRQQPPLSDTFRPAYCQALYPIARALVLEGRHRQALGAYQEMLTWHCQRPGAYILDAAECLLAIQQPEEARRLANDLFNDYASLLSSSEAERTGDVLFEAGDEGNARRAYELALSKLRAGQD